MTGSKKRNTNIYLHPIPNVYKRNFPKCLFIKIFCYVHINQEFHNCFLWIGCRHRLSYSLDVFVLQSNNDNWSQTGRPRRVTSLVNKQVVQMSLLNQHVAWSWTNRSSQRVVEQNGSSQTRLVNKQVVPDKLCWTNRSFGRAVEQISRPLSYLKDVGHTYWSYKHIIPP